jgi:mannose-1-phosphate guanylyltransferase
MNTNNYVAIMAGGIGSRFWPMSRQSHPKQFLDILNTGKTLLQSTYERYLGFIPNENIYIVTSEEYVSIVKQQLPHLPEQNILGEPERKNTAPCIAYISLKIHQLNPYANLIVAPSDHLIEDTVAFQQTCETGLSFTETNNAFVTLGVQPTYANTGYGYIEFENRDLKPSVFPVKRFTEKPTLEKATAFIESGAYLWNAGIFIWKTRDIIAAFRLYAPKMYDVFVCGLPDFNTPNEKAAVKHIFHHCENVSIDYAVMEKAQNVFVIPAAFDWSDLGTWNSAWENFDKDERQNAVAGENTVMVEANGCVVHSTEKKLVLVGGVENLIVVNTPDALLVCKKQHIKEYLQKVKLEKGALYL